MAVGFPACTRVVARNARYRPGARKKLLATLAERGPRIADHVLILLEARGAPAPRGTFHAQRSQAVQRAIHLGVPLDYPHVIARLCEGDPLDEDLGIIRPLLPRPTRDP